jgi:hypothetical protein
MAAFRPLPALLSGLPMMVDRPIPDRASEVGLVLSALPGSLTRMLQSPLPMRSRITKPHFVHISSPDSTSVIFSPSPQLEHMTLAGFIMTCFDPLYEI